MAHFERHRKDGFVISTDPALIDTAAVHEYLARSYWANGIPLSVVRKSIQSSLCFGLYEGKRQVGFARAVTDRATFAYLCDVYVLEEYRGRGLGVWLIEGVVSHPELSSLRRFMLATKDAHGLYRRFEFQPLEKPELFMQINHSDFYNRLAAGEKFRARS